MPFKTLLNYVEANKKKWRLDNLDFVLSRPEKLFTTGI